MEDDANKELKENNNNSKDSKEALPTESKSRIQKFTDFEEGYLAGIARTRAENSDVEDDARNMESNQHVSIDPLENDPNKSVGVLLSNEIEDYCNQNPPLIQPFNPERLGSARYNLSLGREFYKDGEYYYLNKENPDLRIEPFSVVIISTQETLNIPRFLIGRWNLKISLVYEGLLWAGAAQVDPGYGGRLFCPIYNLSNQEVILKFNEPLVAIDFVKTTKFIPGKSKPYSRTKRDTVKISPLIRKKLETGPKETLKRVSKLEKQIGEFQKLAIFLFTVFFTVLAVVVAVLALNFAGFLGSPPIGEESEFILSLLIQQTSIEFL